MARATDCGFLSRGLSYVVVGAVIFIGNFGMSPFSFTYQNTCSVIGNERSSIYIGGNISSAQHMQSAMSSEVRQHKAV